MRTHLLTLLLLLLVPLTAHAVEWQAFPYTESYSRVCRMGQYLYILKSGILVRADASTWQVDQQLTREDGLSATDIVDICYSEEARRLAVVYRNGYIDILHPDGSLWTVPDYYSAPMEGIDKTILGAREQEGLLFVSTAFGFFVVDLRREVILQTFHLGTPVRCAWAYRGDWYYSTDRQTFFCPQAGNPFAPDAWQPASDHAIAQVVVVSGGGVSQCWQMGSDNSLRRLMPGSRVSQRCTPGGTILSLARADRFVMTTTADSLILYDTRFGHCPAYEKAPQPNQRLACVARGHLSGATSLCALTSGGNDFAFLHPSRGIFADTLSYTSPYALKVNPLYREALTFDNHQQSPDINRIVASDGELGMTLVQPLLTNYGVMMRTPGFLTTLSTESQTWSNYTASTVSPYIEKQRFSGIADMIADPHHASRYWFSTLEDGIIGIDHGQFYQVFNHANTGHALQWCSPNCCRVTGLAFDPSGNLWCFNEGVDRGLCVLQVSDSTWHTFVLPGLEKAYGFTHLCHTTYGNRHQVWGYQQLQYSTTNVFVYDYGTDIDRTSDDRFTYFKTLTPTSGTAFTPYYGRGIYEGPGGAIWLLNTSGLYVIDRPSSVFTSPGVVRTVLDGTIPTAIAIDHRQRVWVSTEGHGLYLLSSDGRQQIDHITSANSILPSDEILSLAYDAAHGDLWMATARQVLRYHYDDEDYDTSSGASLAAYCHPSSVTLGSRAMVNVFGLTDGTPYTVENSQGRTLLKGTALGEMCSIDTSAFPVGTYTVFGTDRDGHRGMLLTFTVDQP